MTPSVRTLQGSKIKSFKGSSSLCPRGANSRGFSNYRFIHFSLLADYALLKDILTDTHINCSYDCLTGNIKLGLQNYTFSVRQD